MIRCFRPTIQLVHLPSAAKHAPSRVHPSVHVGGCVPLPFVAHLREHCERIVEWGAILPSGIIGWRGDASDSLQSYHLST